MSLVRLPNGNWVDAWCFNGIRTKENARDKGRQPAALVIDLISGASVFINYDTHEQAEADRDQLADLVNAARRNDPTTSKGR